jgi:hypothetical protein
MATQTVREVLYFSALLKLPGESRRGGAGWGWAGGGVEVGGAAGRLQPRLRLLPDRLPGQQAGVAGAQL